MSRKSGEKTLLMSVILSSPGPLVVGLGLLAGRSSTQLADFIRRSAELAAIIVSYILYRILYGKGEPESSRQQRLERIADRTVGGAMVLSGVAMLIIALVSENNEKGNVIPGFVIATLGVITNTWFWLRYRRLDRRQPDGILATQSKLYRAKALVDTAVMAALLVILIAPDSRAAGFTDLAGSLVVSVYLVINGIMTGLGRRPHAGDPGED